MKELDLRSKKFYLLLLLLILVSIPVAFAIRKRASPPMINDVASTRGAVQDPKQVEYYRKNAAAFRKQAEAATGDRKACYIAWADYYDCKADQIESGVNKQCVMPECNPEG